MLSIKEQSLIEAAERILREKKEPLNLYDLFNAVCAEKGYKKDEKTSLITQFYTDLITSARFVYTGDNMWDLKDFQKRELSEKDGSFYKEYTKIPDLDGEETKKSKTKAKTKAKSKAKVKPKPKVVEEKVEEVKEVKEAKEVKEVKKEKPVKKAGKNKKAKKTEEIKEEKPSEYEEELFEEPEDEFDEDKYNEYMDTYENKYDEK